MIAFLCISDLKIKLLRGKNRKCENAVKLVDASTVFSLEIAKNNFIAIAIKKLDFVFFREYNTHCIFMQSMIDAATFSVNIIQKRRRRK